MGDPNVAPDLSQLAKSIKARQQAKQELEQRQHAEFLAWRLPQVAYDRATDRLGDIYYELRDGFFPEFAAIPGAWYLASEGIGQEELFRSIAEKLSANPDALPFFKLPEIVQLAGAYMRSGYESSASATEVLQLVHELDEREVKAFESLLGQIKVSIFNGEPSNQLTIWEKGPLTSRSDPVQTAPIQQSVVRANRNSTTKGRNELWWQWKSAGEVDSAILDRWNSLPADERKQICPAKPGKIDDTTKDKRAHAINHVKQTMAAMKRRLSR